MKKYIYIIAALVLVLLNGCATINSNITLDKTGKIEVTEIKEKKGYVHINLKDINKNGGTYLEKNVKTDIYRTMRVVAKTMNKNGYKYFVLTDTHGLNNLSGSPINTVSTLARIVTIDSHGKYRDSSGFKFSKIRHFEIRAQGYTKPIPTVFMWSTQETLRDTRGY